jgi:6-pyruvoyltetrahydropterin/6-carboxytetrahydropterin synthase
VTVRGPIEEQTGLVVNLLSLDGIVRERVLERYDHRNLNSDVTAFQKIPPTTENLTTEIRKDLATNWPAGFPALERIRIYETDRNIFEESVSRA